MITKITLDKEDIKRILADYFKVKPSDVDIDLFMTWVGYGLNEHRVQDIEITINNAEVMQR